MTTTVVSYRLRGGQIRPIKSSCAGGSQIDGFLAQTFGAEKVVTDIFDAKTTLLASNDFQGQKPTTTSLGIEDPTYIATTYTKASYQGRPLRTTDGELVFSASEEFVTSFIDEDDIGTA
jgi:hypothetical protein